MSAVVAERGAQMKKGLRVFCSYSHRDEELRNEFAPYLAILEREGLVTSWHDRKIPPGTEWAAEIDENLKSSDLVLLFISAHFIQSNYAFNVEMKRSLEMHETRRARVVPVLVRTTPLDGTMPFERLQSIPRDRRAVTSWRDRDEAWSTVTTELRDLARELLSTPSQPIEARRVRLKCRSMPNEIICVFDRTALIGRAATCDIAAVRAPPSLGKQHARFFYDEKRTEFGIEDLDSRNGTFVDGERTRTRSLRMGSRVDLAQALRFTFWSYRADGSQCGALLYSPGTKEIARYILAPSRRVGIGTTNQDAVQLPLLSDGRAIGTLEASDGLLYYAEAGRREKVVLRDGGTIDANAVKVDVTILE